MPLAPEQLDIVLRIFDDRRALIAAGKVQRWEVAKWVLTVNFALAAAAASPSLHSSGFFLFLLAVAISAMGFILLRHYNLRMTKVRASLRTIHQNLQKELPNINEIVGDSFADKEKTIDYDKQEMTIFYAASLLSVFPVVITLLN